MTFQLIATLCAALFTGAAIYINLVEHPARMSLGTATALAEWKPSYRRATLMQAPLAIAGLAAALGAWPSAAVAHGSSAAWCSGPWCRSRCSSSSRRTSSCSASTPPPKVTSTGLTRCWSAGTDCTRFEAC